MNKVLIIGHVGQAPELRYTPTGKAVAMKHRHDWVSKPDYPEDGVFCRDCGKKKGDDMTTTNDGSLGFDLEYLRMAGPWRAEWAEYTGGVEPHIVLEPTKRLMPQVEHKNWGKQAIDEHGKLYDLADVILRVLNGEN